MNERKAIRKNVKPNKIIRRNVAIWNWTIKYRINILLLNFPSQQIKLCTNWLPFEINTIEHHNKQQYPIDTKHDFPPHFVDIWIINELRIFCLIHWLSSSVEKYREIKYNQSIIQKIYLIPAFITQYSPIKMWKTIRKISLGCNWIFWLLN